MIKKIILYVIVLILSYKMNHQIMSIIFEIHDSYRLWIFHIVNY